MRRSSRGASATLWTILPAPDDDECGVRIGRGNSRLQYFPIEKFSKKLWLKTPQIFLYTTRTTWNTTRPTISSLLRVFVASEPSYTLGV
jgi:hypothetical protein